MTTTFSNPLRVALALTILAVAASSASAQIQAYHHRSTVYGDHLGGLAEVIHADGLAARNHAKAYQTLVRAEREREQLRQEQFAAYHYEQQLRQQQIQRKADENRARRALEAQRLEQSAQYLLQDVQNKSHVWPAALRQPEFAGHLLQVESILRDWDAGYPSDRRALRFIAEELREEIAQASHVDFLDRVAAMDTIKQIDVLARLRDLPSGGNSNGQQLARR